MGFSPPATAVFLLVLEVMATTHALVDVPSQLYALHQQSGSQFASIVEYLPAELPDIVTTRLGGANFTALPTALQLALLWDSGLVFSGGYGRLVQVQTPCGQPMSDVFVRTEAVEAAGCDLVVCNAQIVNFAAPNCSTSAMVNEVRCAIDQADAEPDSALPSISDTTLWSEDGEIDASSSFLLYRFKIPASSSSGSSPGSDSSSSNATTSTLLYTINEKPGVRMTDILSCPNQATAVVPCQALTTDTNSVTRSAWCTPANGELVDLWLAQEVAGVGSGSSSTWSHVAIVFISLFSVLTALATITALVYRRRHRPPKESPSPAQACTSPPETPAHGRAFFGWGRQKSMASQSSQAAGPMTSTSGEMQHFNVEVCRQSPELRRFCEDKELLVKKISYRSLRFGGLIARGANGEVWRGEYAQQTVAIKRLPEEVRGDLRCLEYFAKEIQLASALEHENIVRFLGPSWRALTELCMVSEFLAHGDLAHYLASPNSKQLTWKRDKLGLAVQIASALVYLHSLVPVIIHRDLKSLNVLLSDDFEAKLSDFGLSRERTFEETMTSGVGTLLWTAPEILRGDRYSEKADIYSFGVVLNELDTCMPPYKLNDEFGPGGSNKFVELLPMIRNGRVTPQFRTDVPPGVLELAQQCLNQDPRNRPNAMQIVYILQSKVASAL